MRSVEGEGSPSAPAADDRGLRSWDPGTRVWDDEVSRLHGRAGAASGRVSMACLGRTGQWGNALLAYFYLRAFADAQGLVPEVPRWIGQDLFGRLDEPMTHAHPVVLYDLVSEICADRHHPMVTASLATSRARRLHEAGRQLVLLREPLLERAIAALAATCLDLEGPYFLHTRHLRSRRDLLRGAVEPVAALRECLEPAWRALRERGDLLVGVHVRRSDFDSKFCHQGFELIAPMAWYRSWLDALWARHQHPVLFVASDAPARVLPALARYRPVTSRDLGVTLPPQLRDLRLPAAHLQRDAAFFPDWFLLTRCDALAISNSTFSFTAAMVNATASPCVRPDPQAGRLVPFDPWDSEPLLFLSAATTLWGEVARRLAMSQRGLGAGATLPNLRRASRWYAEILLARATAARHYSGTAGLLRELLRPHFYLASRRRYDEGVEGAAEADLPALPPWPIVP